MMLAVRASFENRTTAFIKFHNAERGYVSCTVTPDHWQSDYLVAGDVTRRDSPIIKRASFVVEEGRPGIA